MALITYGCNINSYGNIQQNPLYEFIGQPQANWMKHLLSAIMCITFLEYKFQEAGIFVHFVYSYISKA